VEMTNSFQRSKSRSLFLKLTHYQGHASRPVRVLFLAGWMD
jgi:hypothetical protein